MFSVSLFLKIVIIFDLVIRIERCCGKINSNPKLAELKRRAAGEHR